MYWKPLISLGWVAAIGPANDGLSRSVAGESLDVEKRHGRAKVKLGGLGIMTRVTVDGSNS